MAVSLAIALGGTKFSRREAAKRGPILLQLWAQYHLYFQMRVTAVTERREISDAVQAVVQGPFRNGGAA
jgi:hypothetical protein